MPIDHVALYLETGDTARLADLLGPVFAQQQSEVGRGPAELWLAALSGWTVVLGAEVLEGRIILAEGLARELGAAAAAVELTAAAFRYQFGPVRQGERLRPAGFGAPPRAAGEPMPLYPDAEREAYLHLVRFGVPPALALLTPDGPGEPVAAVSLRWDGAALSRAPFELRPVLHPAGEPPVRLLWPPADAAEGGVDPAPAEVALEPRVVSGRPTEAALRRLLELEAAYEARAGSPVRFLYRHAPEATDFHVARELARLTEGGQPSLLSRLFKR